MWRSGSSPLTGPRIAIDTETELIVDHRTPPLVLMQVYSGGDTVHLVKWQDAKEYLDRLSEACPKSRVVFHNAPFDIAVLDGHQWLETGVEDGRIGDTMLRFALWKLATMGDYVALNLATAARDVIGMPLNKSEDIRLTFSRDMIEPDAAHKEYAAADVIATWRIDEAIPRSGTQTEETQVKAAMALYDISRTGLAVDEQRRAKLEARFTRKVEETLEILDANGYVPGKTGNKAALQTALKLIETMYGIKLPRTEKKGEISVSKEAMAEMSEDIPFLSALKEHDHYNKILSTYLQKGVAGVDGRVHTRFNTLIKTGRTSSSKPNLLLLNELQLAA
jgi:DNA polymerase I-like protein with 3'-5' exonuclease and polymerase domains